MNDRYLYRAKRCDTGEWVVGYLVETRHNTYHDGYRIIDKNGINYDELDYYEPSFISYVIDKTTICQCTGLKDKNGKLIWENDIVWDSEERKFYKIIFSQEDMCYYAQDADGYKHTFESCYGSSIDVESNIFDNLELLEVGE